MITKNSNIKICFKLESHLEPYLGCILLEDSISFIRVLSNTIELLIPWNNIDYIEEIVEKK